MLYTRFKFGSNWPIGCGEEDEKMKSLQTDRHADGQTDRWQTGWSEKSNKIINACLNIDKT